MPSHLQHPPISFGSNRSQGILLNRFVIKKKKNVKKKGGGEQEPCRAAPVFLLGVYKNMQYIVLYGASCPHVSLFLPCGMCLLGIPKRCLLESIPRADS